MTGYTRFRWTILIIAAFLGGALTFKLASPLFIDRTVDESFPLVGSAVVPEGMTHAEVSGAMTAMAKIDQPMSEAMPEQMAIATVVKQGEFRDADGFHRGSGRATIYSLPGGSRILRLEELAVTNGPALHVFLSEHPDPMTPDDLKGAAYTDLGKLKGNIGNQNYEIPGDVEVEGQGSVVIYCVPFQVVFSVAPLR